jgi:hypothetical protein
MNGFLKAAANRIKKPRKLLTLRAFHVYVCMCVCMYFMWLIAAFRNPVTTAFVSLQENQQKFVSFFIEAVSKSVIKYRRNYRVKKFLTKSCHTDSNVKSGNFVRSPDTLNFISKQPEAYIHFFLVESHLNLGPRYWQGLFRPLPTSRPIFGVS